eukprot:ctg_1240.g411
MAARSDSHSGRTTGCIRGLVHLHPLVVLHLTDHYTRARRNASRVDTASRCDGSESDSSADRMAQGLLFGTVHWRDGGWDATPEEGECAGDSEDAQRGSSDSAVVFGVVEAFECGDVTANTVATLREMMQKTLPAVEVIGWYTVGSGGGVEAGGDGQQRADSEYVQRLSMHSAVVHRYTPGALWLEMHVETGHEHDRRGHGIGHDTLPLRARCIAAASTRHACTAHSWADVLSSLRIDEMPVRIAASDAERIVMNEFSRRCVLPEADTSAWAAAAAAAAAAAVETTSAGGHCGSASALPGALGCPSKKKTKMDLAAENESREQERAFGTTTASRFCHDVVASAVPPIPTAVAPLAQVLELARTALTSGSPACQMLHSHLVHWRNAVAMLHERVQIIQRFIGEHRRQTTTKDDEGGEPSRLPPSDTAQLLRQLSALCALLPPMPVSPHDATATYMDELLPVSLSLACLAEETRALASAGELAQTYRQWASRAASPHRPRGTDVNR